MNFKKNFKRFFTLSRSAEGFTLVELIVVIAILGILVGVGMPAYAGYIDKANEGVDEHNLAMMNNALSVACVYMGVEPADVNAGMEWSADGKSFVQLLEPGRTTPEGETVVSIFNTSLGLPGNPIEFKKYTSADITLENGVFVGPNGAGGSGSEGGSTVPVTVVENEDGTFTYTAGDLTVTLNSADKTTLSGENAFSDRGSEALLNDVAVLENLLTTGIGDTVLEEVVATEDFINALGGYLGLTQGENEDNEAYGSRVEAALEKTGNADSALYSAQIMYAASQAAKATDEQISKLFTGTVTSNIEVKNEDGSTDYTATMANAALAYGMYTAYVQQNNIDTSTNAGNFTNVINSKEFATYYAGQGQADLEAYQAAMNMISDNTGNSDVTSSILANGINGNAELEALMKEIMGK